MHEPDARWRALRSFAYVEALTVHLTAILVLTIAPWPRQMDKRLRIFTNAPFRETPVLLLWFRCYTKAINVVFLCSKMCV